MNKITTYFREAMAEMKKVVWPTKKQTTNYTFMVIGLSLGIAILFKKKKKGEISRDRPSER